MLNKRGFSTIELLVSFVIISFLTISMFRAALLLNDKLFYYINTSKIIVFDGIVTNYIQKDLKYQTVSEVNACGTNCYDIVYKAGTTRRLEMNTTSKYIKYGTFVQKLPEDTSFTGNITVSNQETIGIAENKNNSIFKITIPIESVVIEGAFDINVVYTYDSRKVMQGSVLSFNEGEGVNTPKLAPGMLAVKYNDVTGMWDYVSNPEIDTSWYDYANQEWANARTSDGSFWVWIPRYAYQIATNYHTSTTGTINIKFLQGNTNIASDFLSVDTNPTYSGNSQTNYITHPAFAFGDNDLTGIWVAKFEASISDTNDLCYTDPSAVNCNTTSLVPKIVPNVSSWHYIDIGTTFAVSRAMETNNNYGWDGTGDNIDTHLIKNNEWGAIIYLTQSGFGKGSEPWVNNSSTLTTGCAGDSLSASEYNGCQYSYETAYGQEASTTGNVYGVYDLSGGGREYVSSYIDNNPETASYGTNIVNTMSKYKDVYPVTTESQENNYLNADDIFGDGIWETSNSYTGSNSWNNDYSTFPYELNIFFIRGGRYSNGQSTGIYAFWYNVGEPYYVTTFRPVLLVETGL